MAWQKDKADVKRQYDSDGYVVVRSFLAADETEFLRTQLQRYVTDIVPNVPPMDAFYDDSENKTGLRMLPRMDQHDDYFARLLTEGRCRELATLLCGAEVVPRDVAFFNKLPLVGEATPPHQDGYYFHLVPCEALTLWLALDDVREDNGCIRYVAKSHRNGMREHRRTQVLGFSQGISDYGTADDLAEERPITAQPGDLIAHHALTIHRADANQSPRSRRAMGFVYFSAVAERDQKASAAYQKQLAADLSAKGKI